MNTWFRQALIGSLLGLTGLSGCKVSLTAEGTLVDLATGRTQPITLAVKGNSKMECGTQLKVIGPEGEAIHSVRSGEILIGDDGATLVDTKRDGCSADSKVAIQARAVDRKIGRETVTKPVYCPNGRSMTGIPGQAPMDTMTVKMDVVVTTVEGQITDKASGRTLQTFTATSEPRFEVISSERGGPANCH